LKYRRKYLCLVAPRADRAWLRRFGVLSRRGSNADDCSGRPGHVEQLADIGAITGRDVCSQDGCDVRNDGVDDVAGPGQPHQVPGCVSVGLCQADHVTPPQQPSQLYLLS
jgi:hypothetical protein